MDTLDVGKPQIIMGDLNSSSAIPAAGINPVYPDIFQMYLDAGYIDANVVDPEPKATWDPDENTLTQFYFVADNNIILAPKTIFDHVMVRNANTSDPKRILDQTVRLFPDQTFNDGNPIDLHLSDHYGMQVKVSKI